MIALSKRSNQRPDRCESAHRQFGEPLATHGKNRSNELRSSGSAAMFLLISAAVAWIIAFSPAFVAVLARGVLSRRCRDRQT
jgi:hypothetical protein